MSGHSARFALPEDERPPVDQRPSEPEFALEKSPPAPAAQPAPTAERPPSDMLPDKPLGRRIPAAADLDLDELIRAHNELTIVICEMARAFGEDRVGIASSAAARARMASTRIMAALEPHKFRERSR